MPAGHKNETQPRGEKALGGSSGQLTFAAINDVAIKHTQAHRTVDEKRALLGQLKLS